MQCIKTAPTTLRPTRVSRFLRLVSPDSSWTSARVGIGMVSVAPQPCGHSSLRPRGSGFTLRPPGLLCGCRVTRGSAGHAWATSAPVHSLARSSLREVLLNIDSGFAYMMSNNRLSHVWSAMSGRTLAATIAYDSVVIVPAGAPCGMPATCKTRARPMTPDTSRGTSWRLRLAGRRGLSLTGGAGRCQRWRHGPAERRSSTHDADGYPKPARPTSPALVHVWWWSRLTLPRMGIARPQLAYPLGARDAPRRCACCNHGGSGVSRTRNRLDHLDFADRWAFAVADVLRRVLRRVRRASPLPTWLPVGHRQADHERARQAKDSILLRRRGQTHPSDTGR
jgi:hypothetical protein